MSKRKDIDIEALRATLLAHKAELEADDALTKDERAPVELDQQAVGRVSRMDALQNHAMAEATHERRIAALRRIEAAEKRMAEGDYGYCLSCDAKIAAKRLELDPAVPTCIKCAEKAEH